MGGLYKQVAHKYFIMRNVLCGLLVFLIDDGNRLHQTACTSCVCVRVYGVHACMFDGEYLNRRVLECVCV